MKKISRWILVFLVGFFAVTVTTLSLSGLNGKAFADGAVTSDDLNAIRRNVLYKAVYSNLQKCYNNMSGTIKETSNNVWASFDSSTYFNSSALASDFLKFPFDVGKRNESSCPKMITGWKTNWFIDIFKGTGSYAGVLSLNVNAEVPDGSYTSSPTKMGAFLKNIGYTQKNDTTTMADRKCFYLRFKINDAIKSAYSLPNPADGSYFETVDYCVKLNGNNLQQGSDAITVLIGNNEYFSSTYDNGHLTDESNIAFIFFNTNTSLAPQFDSTDYSGVSWANKTYLQANLSSTIDLRYPYSSDFGSQLHASTITIKNIRNSTDAESSSFCSSLGYTWCGWYDKGILSARQYIGSLTAPGDNISYSEFQNRLKTVVADIQTNDGYRVFDSVTVHNYTPGETSYSKGPTNTKFMQYFLGNTSGFNSGNLSDAEKYVLYYTYLKESYNVATTTSPIENGVQVTWLKDDGSFSKVYIYDPDENLNDKKYVPSANQWLNLTELNWKEIAERMATINPATAFKDAEITESVLDPTLKPSDGDNNTTTTDDTSTLALCYQGAGALGWIACPVIEAVGGATQNLYNNFIEPMLQVKAGTIMDRDKGAYVGWSSFRNFANILFVIGFAVIILAQVTGIGISSYNIKKILPRLIMVAVLVNISFIVCQLAVDISNLVGSSIVDVFGQLPVPGAEGSKLADHSMDIVGTILAWLGLGTVAVAVISLPVALSTISFWIIPVLVSLLGCLISVLFFFIILAARQAGVIILVVLAPIAIVCYALPNTKFIFDRWKKLFMSLLLVYPICGLLMGGGQYAGALLLSIGGGDDFSVFYTITAMLVTVLPFFMIPSLLKSSMAMMGNLGMKISNFGSRFQNGVTRGIRGSRAFQEHQTEEQRRLNYERDQTRVGRLSATGKGGGVIGRARRALGMNNNLSSRQATRAAIAQGNIDRATDATAQALRARWESDGTANDFAGLTDRYTRATERLFNNPADRDAIEEQKAAAMLLAASKPGRSMLREANNTLGDKIATMSDDAQRATAKQVMQRSANNLLRTNGGDIAKSPLLDEQITSLQNTSDDSIYGSLNSVALASSINKLNSRTMSDMANADLKDYLRAATSGQLEPDDFRTLVSTAQKTLSDPRYQGQIKADARKTLSQLADLGYRRRADSGASDAAVRAIRNENMASLAGVDDAEFDRIRSRIKSGQMKEVDPNNPNQESDYGTEMLDLMGNTLMQAMAGEGSVKLSAGRAAQISQTLQENGYDLASLGKQYGISDPTQMQEKLDIATGMKVPRAPRQTLGERHANWQRATEAQATASSGKFSQGDWINTTTGRKLSQKDAMEAEMLEKRDLEAQEAAIREKIERDDADYRRSRTPIPMPPSSPPTPPNPNNP